MKISVFGMGYVGVISGSCLARLGHTVIGVDVSAQKVALINSGQSPIVEAGIGPLVADLVAAGKLSATSDGVQAVLDSELTFISVGTPGDRNGAPRLDSVRAVLEQIGQALKMKNAPHMVIVRSTVPPGTIESLVVPTLCEKSGRALGPQLSVCSNPEFLREGSAIRDFEAPPFTLIGTANERDTETLKSLYQGIVGPTITTDVRTAETIKYLCNIFHAVKIGFANEVGSVLKSIGVDAREAMRIFCEDRTLNISPAYLRPGFAFGGSCLPKDVRAFLATARQNGVDLPFLGSLMESNSRHIDRAFEIIARNGRRKVALFGLSFKPGTDDLRESPLVALAEKLIGKGYDLTIYDKDVNVARLTGANREFIEREIPHFERLLRPSARETLEGAETIVVGHCGPPEVDEILASRSGRPIVDLQGVKKFADLEETECQGICW